jgi:hypothetical protein
MKLIFYRLALISIISFSLLKEALDEASTPAGTLATR